jgi:predicted phosphodiesterase
VRVFALSDIHVDYRENEQWVSDLSDADFQDDTLLLAGDVSENLRLMERCFLRLTRKFRRVVFVPGNHDLWVNRSEIPDSVSKYQRILKLAAETGIMMEPTHCEGLCIVPLLGWYDFAFGEPDAQLLSAWMDFKACAWPPDWNMKDVTEFFVNKNAITRKLNSGALITFSHFLPRIDLLPEYIPKSFRYLYPVMGSPKLEKQIRALNPQIHVYGHSHVNRQVRLNGILYVNNAFGSPSETRTSRKDLLCIYTN